MNHKPFIAAICGIIAVGTILILASGPGQRVRSAPGDMWTLTYSIPGSNKMVQLSSLPGGQVKPPPGGPWTLTFSVPASNRPADIQTHMAP